MTEVISKYFETHERLILREGLGEKSKAHIVDLIVGHVKMDQRLVHGNCLSDGFGTVVTTLVVGEVK